MALASDEGLLIHPLREWHLDILARFRGQGENASGNAALQAAF
jgi:hypothetical protein